MKTTTTATTILLTTTTTAVVSGFSVLPPSSQSQISQIVSSSSSSSSNTRYSTELNGLFDGVKDAFSQPPQSIDSERETPIDRWMGWSVVTENEIQEPIAQPSDYVDSMDEKNYIGVSLSKPMGIVFEENDSEFGGIFVQSLTEDGIAAKDGTIQDGDQLVTVGNKNVNGLDFDDALAAIIESDGDKTNLTLFRGSAKQFYGPTGPSKDWLTTFAEKGGKTGDAAAAASPPAEE